MGKPQKAKSRAARRQATPPMEIGPIVRHTTPPPKEKVALLGVRDNSGVKKKSKKKQLTAKQKARQHAAMEKAEAAMGKLEKKREESRGKSRVIQTRAVSVPGVQDVNMCGRDRADRNE